MRPARPGSSYCMQTVGPAILPTTQSCRQNCLPGRRIAITKANERRPAVDKVEQIKWSDALELIIGQGGVRNITLGLRLVRKCQHPDAQWLASHFSNAVLVRYKDVLRVSRYVKLSARQRVTGASGRAGLRTSPSPLGRVLQSRPDRVLWAEKAAVQGDRGQALNTAHRRVQDQTGRLWDIPASDLFECPAEEPSQQQVGQFEQEPFQQQQEPSGVGGVHPDCVCVIKHQPLV